MLTRDRNEETFMDIALREGHSEVAFAVIRHERWVGVLLAYVCVHHFMSLTCIII